MFDGIPDPDRRFLYDTFTHTSVVMIGAIGNNRAEIDLLGWLNQWERNLWLKELKEFSLHAPRELIGEFMWVLQHPPKDSIDIVKDSTYRVAEILWKWRLGM